MIHNVDPQLSQWDVGRSVSVADSTAKHIHFANQGDSKAVIIEITEGSAKIPDFLLQTGKTLIAYAVLDGVTLESKSFPVRKRERPENYVYEDDKRNYIYELITNAQEATTAASNAAEVATQAAQNAVSSSDVALGSADRANKAADDAEKASASANKAATMVTQTAKSLMVVGKAMGTSIYLDDAIAQPLVSCKIFGKTTQDGTPAPDAPVELVSAGDGGSIGVIVCGKNLLKNTVESYTSHNIAFTKNADGSVSYSGTSTDGHTAYYYGMGEMSYKNAVLYKAGTYVYSVGDSSVSVLGRIIAEDGSFVDVATGRGSCTFTLKEDSYVWFCAMYATLAGHSYNGVFYPMVRLASITDSTYEPYKDTTATVSTPNGLPGIPVTSGGNYTDANGQQWICDEIDFARGVHIHRVQVVSKFAKIETTNTNSVYQETSANEMVGQEAYLGALCTHTDTYHYTANNTTHFYIDGRVVRVYLPVGTDVTGLKVYAILKAPIETPLSEEELAAYAALHTYRDHTTISNDAGAHMELEYVMDARKYIDSVIAGTLYPATVE